MPALLLGVKPALLVDVRGSLAGALELHVLGVFALVAGVTLALEVPGRLPAGKPAPLESVSIAARRALALSAVPAVSFCLFTIAVGGPGEYLTHLDDTGSLTAGLTYLIWGILAAKYAPFALLALRWRAGVPSGRALITATAAGLVLIALIGSRLLAIVAILQFVMLFLMLRGLPRERAVSALGLVLVLGAIFLCLGELRRWQGLDSNGGGFMDYLVHRGIPEFPATYVNQYADSVRLAAITRELVPEQAGYEYGEELVRIVLQPIPGQVRPVVEQAPALRQAFRTGANGNALTLPVVGFIQFGLAGVVVFCGLLGFAAGWLDRLLVQRPGIDLLLPALGAVTGLLIVYRGSLVNGVAFMLMDVIGFAVVYRLLVRGEHQRRLVAEAAAGRYGE